MPTPINPPLVWTTIEFDHDWRISGFVSRWVEAVLALSLIGTVESLEVGPDDRRSRPPSDVSQLPHILWQQGDDAKIVAQGHYPRPWRLTVSVFSPDPQTSNGRLALRFDGEFGSSNNSNELWQAFRRVIDDNNVSCSYIDTWEGWLDLRDEPPIISQAAFESVFWANFIDPSLMKMFRRHELDLSAAASAEWTASGGLYLRLDDVLRPGDENARSDLERRRRQLREEFLHARTY
jgi:hypothetical protein